MRAAGLGGSVPAALLRGGALRECGEGRAERLATSSVGVELTVLTGIAVSLRGSVGARSGASRSGPDAGVVGIAAGGVSVSVLALGGAGTTGPHAEGVFLAGSFGRGTAASSTAFTVAGVPHTGRSLQAGVLAESLALACARGGARGPLARGVGVAGVGSGGGRAGRVAGLGDGVEGAARDGASLASGVDGSASGCADIAGPVAESGLLALGLVGVDDNAQLRADLEVGVPLAIGVLVARALGGVASRALLFATSSGVEAAEVVGGALSGVGARAVISAASVDGVPHTFGVDVALSLVLVAVDALEGALGTSAGGEPVARRIVGAGRLHELELALLAAEVVLGIPVAHGLSSA